MFKRKIFVLILVSILLSVIDVKATHIVGGELNYKYLGKDIYEIRLTVYRDCWVGVPPFDNFAVVGIHNSKNDLLYTLNMPFRGLDTLPPTINDPCTIPPLDFCYEVTTYIDTVKLPPIEGGYQLAYQRCCRNQFILNIVNPTCTGATYYATIPGPEVVKNNSNPVIKFWPPPFICVDKPWVFDNSASDFEGDSLVYELYMPYEGLTAPCPIIRPIVPNTKVPCVITQTSCPSIPVNPPFNTITWLPPYSTENMLGGIPMKIDKNTGLVTATPNRLGYFVIGVKIKEYRKGVFLSETKRDFQLIVKACPQLIVAAAQAPTYVCNSKTVDFTNNSSGSSKLSYYWNFGDETTLKDTSRMKAPSYTYPNLGTYTVSLIAFLDQKPLCNDTGYTTVNIMKKIDGSFIYNQFPCNNKLDFIGEVNSVNKSDIKWSWDFGNKNSLNDTSFLQKTSYNYPGAGEYTVSLITYLDQKIYCSDTSYTNIIIQEPFTVSITNNTVSCLSQVDFAGKVEPTQNSNVKWNWNFGDNRVLNDTSNLQNPSYNYPELATTYTVNLKAYIEEKPFCNDTTYSVIRILDYFKSSFTYSPIPCTDKYQFIGDGYPIENKDINWNWSFGDGNKDSIYNPIHTYKNKRDYDITLITELKHSIGCIDTISGVIITFEPLGKLFIPNTFTPNNDGFNDLFLPRGVNYPVYYFQVRNRWGELMFETTNPNEGWDGNYRGRSADPGVFGYYIKVKCDENGEEIFKKGNVTLIR